MSALSPSASTTTLEVAIALEYAPLGVPLSEIEARHDLAQATRAHPDAHYATRWAWRAEDVATLRGGVSWRERDELPTKGRMP